MRSSMGATFRDPEPARPSSEANQVVQRGLLSGGLEIRAVYEFPRPTFRGDTLYAQTLVFDRRRSRSRPGDGIVTFQHRGHNQNNEVVAIARRTALMHGALAGSDA